MNNAKVASPYIGLVPYTEQDSRFFFGREREQRIVVANLFASHLTLLYGASGVGKSSLLQAGVVKELRRRISFSIGEGERPDLAVVYFNEWQGQLLARLRDAFRRSFEDVLPRPALDAALARPSLFNGLRALGRFRRDVFIIFDQFEEFFLYHITVSVRLHSKLISRDSQMLLGSRSASCCRCAMMLYPNLITSKKPFPTFSQISCE